jgi:hemoglobin
MPSVYETAGRDEGVLRLAEAWHARVTADEVVSRALSQGFHPKHSERLAAWPTTTTMSAFHDSAMTSPKA